MNYKLYKLGLSCAKLRIVELKIEENKILGLNENIDFKKAFHSLCKEYASSQHNDEIATVQKLSSRWLCKKEKNRC